MEDWILEGEREREREGLLLSRLKDSWVRVLTRSANQEENCWSDEAVNIDVIFRINSIYLIHTSDVPIFTSGTLFFLFKRLFTLFIKKSEQLLRYLNFFLAYKIYLIVIRTEPDIEPVEASVQRFTGSTTVQPVQPVL